VRASTAQKILRQVRDSYHRIGHEFSDTRRYGWEEFKFFKKYLFANSEIVDLGCGNGRLINFLDQYFLGETFRYIGIDNSTALLEKAHQLFPRNLFLPGDQLQIPVDDGQVDLLFNIAAFHHIPSRRLRLEALQEMKRVLKPGGLLIMTVWNLWQWKYWQANLAAWGRFIFTFGSYAPNDLFIPWKNNRGKTLSKRYYHSFLPGELSELVRRSGLEIIERYSVKKGLKLPFLQSHNQILIARRHE
jgi:SAM-dependent methyltransferase